MNLKSGAFIINLNVAQSFSSRIFNFYSVFKLVAMLKKIVDNQYVLVTIHLNFLLWAGFLPSSKAPSLVTASQTGLPWIWMLRLSLDDLSHLWTFSLPLPTCCPPPLTSASTDPTALVGVAPSSPVARCFLWWHSRRWVAIMYLVLYFPLDWIWKFPISSSFWYTYCLFKEQSEECGEYI